MAGDAETKKISVNGTTSGYNPTTQDQIQMALFQTGGVRRIQANFEQRLDEAGWSQNLREYCERLFRSGEATTYEEALNKALSHIRLQGADEDARSTVNGTANGDGAPDLVIPRKTANEAAEFVRKELASVVKMEK